MADVTPVTPPVVEGAPATPPAVVEGQFTPIASKEELDKILQSETDKRVTQAIQTAKLKWEAESSVIIEAAKSEAAKMAKMTADQKKEYEIKQREDALSLKEKQLASRDLQLETIKVLNDRKLPVDFSEYLMADNAASTVANIEKFEQLWQSKLEEAVNMKLKGTTPKAGQSTGLTMDDINKMSAAEINSRWDEVKKVMNQK